MLTTCKTSHAKSRPVGASHGLKAGSRWTRPSMAALVVVLSLAACSSAEQRAEEYYRSGIEFLEKKEFAKAAIEFRSALQLNEDHAGSWFGMALVEEQKKNWPRVAGDLKKVIEIDPRHIKAHTALARMMLLAGSFPDAMAEVNAAFEIAPRDPDIMALKATALLKLGDLAGSVALSNRLLAIKPGSEEALLILAAERRQAGDMKAALEFADRGLKANPGSAGLRLFKIEVYESMGDARHQELVIRDLVQAFPEEPAYRQGLITYYLRAKRNDDAERTLREAVFARPGDIQANLDVVGFLASTKGSDAARLELVRLIGENQGNPVYRTALAELLFQQGNVDRAAEILRDVIKAEGISEGGIATRVDLAAKFSAAGRFDDAQALVDEVLENDSRNTGGFKVRAGINAAKGNTEAAIADLREALNNDPNNADLKRGLAQLYERAGAIELANKEMGDAAAIAGLSPAIALEYAGLLARHGNLDRSEDVLLEAAGNQPNDPDVLKALAEIKLRRKDWEGAEQVAEAIGKLGVDASITNQILGAALAGQNKLSESVKLLRSAQALAPAQAQPLFQLVRALFATGKPDEALSLVRSAIKANPDNVPALIMLASIQASNQQTTEAEASLNLALEKSRNDSLAYRAFADFLGNRGRFAEALKLLHDAAGRFPDDMDVHISLAGWLERSGDSEAAITEFEFIAGRRPGSMVVANNLASLLAEHRTDKDSLERAARHAAILRNSDVPQFQDTLGWVLFKNGDITGAIDLLEKSAQKLPDVPEVNFHLGAAFAAGGKKDAAARQLKLALSQTGNDELHDKISSALKELEVN